MKFETSKDTNDFIEDVYWRVHAPNKAVLGRSGLFLALGEGLPAEFKCKDSNGVTLNEETVLGEELSGIVRASLNLRNGRKLDNSEYRRELRRYFEFGCMRLKTIWEDSGNDHVKFVSALVKLTSKHLIPDRNTLSSHELPANALEIRLDMLKDEQAWSLNGPGTKNGLLVISGQPGTGKSQLALDLLMQLSQQNTRFIFFDMKGELEDSQLSSDFLRSTQANHIKLIDESLPINPLYRDADSSQAATVAHAIASLIRCFAPQLGAKQERAIVGAYKQLSKPDFTQLESALLASGAEGVDVAVIEKINAFNLFADDKDALSAEDWLQQSAVIDFKRFENDSQTKALAAALILNFIMNQLNNNLPTENGVQPIKTVLFVDEAHLLLPTEHKANLLSSLARQGRSWGLPLWLASQDADKFITSGAHKTNFAELAECGVHFSPETLTTSQQKAVLGQEFKRQLNKTEAVLRMHNKLYVGLARQFWRDSQKG